MTENSRALTVDSTGHPPQRRIVRDCNRRMMVGLYTPTAVEYLPYNSNSPAVAQRVAAVILDYDRSLEIAHIGSTSVPGCWGRGIIDLLVTYGSGGLAAARESLQYLGFQRQGGPEAFPESRPMRVGSVTHLGRIYRLHAHVIAAGHPEARDLVRFRDLLRENSDLRRAYEAEKRTILARGISRGAEYSNAKGEFIRRALSLFAEF